MGINKLGAIAVTHIADWGVGADGNKLRNGKAINNVPGVYSINGGDVMINVSGPPAKVRYCTNAILPINFWRDDGFLLAKDPSANANVNAPPFTITFVKPVSAVGAYISALGPTLNNDDNIQAIMWARMTNDPTWYPITADGKVSTVIREKGEPATAPFVGATADPGQSIEQVRFDASLAVSFQTLALSKLYWG